jgi:hypothetical protein
MARSIQGRFMIHSGPLDFNLAQSAEIVGRILNFSHV